VLQIHTLHPELCFPSCVLQIHTLHPEPCFPSCVLQIHTGYTEAVKDVVDVDPKCPPKVGGHDNSSPKYSDIEGLLEMGNLKAVIDELAAQNPGIPITRYPPPLLPLTACAWTRLGGVLQTPPLLPLTACAWTRLGGVLQTPPLLPLTACTWTRLEGLLQTPPLLPLTACTWTRLEGLLQTPPLLPLTACTWTRSRGTIQAPCMACVCLQRSQYLILLVLYMICVSYRQLLIHMPKHSGHERSTVSSARRKKWMVIRPDDQVLKHNLVVPVQGGVLWTQPGWRAVYAGRLLVQDCGLQGMAVTLSGNVP
jgi:hypothetical protein